MLYKCYTDKPSYQHVGHIKVGNKLKQNTVVAMTMGIIPNIQTTFFTVGKGKNHLKYPSNLVTMETSALLSCSNRTCC